MAIFRHRFRLSKGAWGDESGRMARFRLGLDLMLPVHDQMTRIRRQPAHAYRRHPVAIRKALRVRKRLRRITKPMTEWARTAAALSLLLLAAWTAVQAGNGPKRGEALPAPVAADH